MSKLICGVCGLFIGVLAGILLSAMMSANKEDEEEK